MDMDELIKENLRLKAEVDSCWRDIADSVRDDAEYRANIRDLKREIVLLREQIQELQVLREDRR